MVGETATEAIGTHPTGMLLFSERRQSEQKLVVN